MKPLDHRRFLFVTGKGGVGKTTVTAALALELTRRGRSVLVATSGAKDQLAPLLGRPHLSTRIENVRDKLWAVRLEPEAALSEYGSLRLKSRLVHAAVFQNRYVRGFFAGVPGLSEWAVLGKAWYHSVETDDSGAPRFDTVIYDAPATGHGLDMLRVPRVILDVAPPGILRRDAEQAWQDFTNPDHTGVVVVSLPEELPTSETVELVQRVRAELGLPIVELVVNGVLRELFSREERAALLAREELSEPMQEAILVCAARRSLRENLQAEQLERLAALHLPTRVLPLLMGGAATTEAVLELSSRWREPASSA
jgi:anion-transporting  ArsA/GET3 family ATPase